MKAQQKYNKIPHHTSNNPKKYSMALTQKEKIGKVLQGLRENVTADDRKEYMEKFGRKKNTASSYLNGTVYDIETGMEMVEFFTARIAARDKKLDQFKLQTV